MYPNLITTVLNSSCRRLIAFALCLTLLPSFAWAAISATDDTGHTVTLQTPAKRIISLAPHTTELLFAAGAGAKLVGVSEYSDYPPAAKKITSVGGAAALDLERIITLKPDLVVIWASGNSATQINKLRSLGIAIFESEPRDFEIIATSLERLSKLAGTEAFGLSAAHAFRTRLSTLTNTYRQRPEVSVFYEIWHEPLMTVNDAHMISTAIQLCGGKNSFGQLPQLTPTISIEAVLQADPEVIFDSGSTDGSAASGWRQFPQMKAVARGNLFSLNADWMSRAGPRILDGTEQLCKQLELARGRRK